MAFKHVRKDSPFARFGAMASFLACPAIGAADEATDEWVFGADIYLWTAAIELETETGSKSEINFDDILDNFNLGGMGLLSASKGRWSFWTDIVYLDLENDDNSAVTPAVELKNTEVSAWIITPQVRYTALDAETYQLGLVAGARYLEIETQFKLESQAPLPPGSSNSSDSGSNWDGILGVTGQIDLTDRWYIFGYADAGTGESDYTWQVAGSVNYRLGRADLTAGYRYLDYDLGNDAAISELSINGPFFGAKFRF